MNSLAEIKKRYAYMEERIREKNVLNFPTCSRLDQIRTVREFLRVIVDCAKGCDNYDFIYFITKLEEQFGSESTAALWEILNQYMLSEEAELEEQTPSSDVAFTALYHLVHHYYRAHDEVRLAELCGSETNYLGVFFKKKYYLTVELFTRYLGIIRRFDTQYRMNLLLQKYVENQTLPKNAALNASYVNSICELCNKKFEMEQQSGFLFKKGSKVKFDDSLFMREYQAIPGMRDRKASRKRPRELKFSVVADWNVALDKALILIDEAIAFNESYPKYHYLKAQTLFFSFLLYSAKREADSEAEDEIYKSIFKAIVKAEERENRNAADYDRRITTYKNFESVINVYRMKSHGDQQMQNALRFSGFDEIFKSDSVPLPQDRPPIVVEKENYLFISYSTKDFKPVYRDIIELQMRNISLWYDINIMPGAEWDAFVEEKIKRCSCFFCYLSKNSLTSPAVIKELRLALKYDRPVFGVNLTSVSIPKLIGEVGGNISTEDIRLFTDTKLFDDKKKVITRDPDYSSIGHILEFISLLEEKFPEVIGTIEAKTLCRRNNIPKKPNEDYCLADTKNQIYVVADGISRPQEEYEECKSSIAAKVSRKFCELFVRELKRKLAVRPIGSKLRAFMYQSFREAFRKANAEVKDLIDREWDGTYEKPGCVAVAAVIADQTLYFGNVGDCVGILVRDHRQMIFAGKQTRYAFEIAGVEEDRELLQQKYVNHPENKYGYGVINGEDSAVEFLNVSHLALEGGDIIYLLSDGLSNLVEFSQCDAFVGMSVEELEATSLADDAELRKMKTSSVRSYDDDRTVIKISIAK